MKPNPFTKARGTLAGVLVLALAGTALIAKGPAPARRPRGPATSSTTAMFI